MTITRDEQIESIRSLKAQGLSDKEIALLVGVSEHKVGKLRRAAGIRPMSPADAGRRGGQATHTTFSLAKAARPKATRPKATRPKRMERMDTCESCGMPFSISAPPAVVKRLHATWLSRHLCEPGRYE